MRISFVPDTPIAEHDDDILGLKAFVELVEISLVNTEPPFVYGILGDWGTGKTSAMQLLQKRLSADFHYMVPIWFNAWQYENEVNVVYPLLHTIKLDYERRVQLASYTQSFTKKFGQVVATSTLALTDLALRAVTKHFTNEALSLEDVADQLQKVQQYPNAIERVMNRWGNQVAELHDAFEELLNLYAVDLARNNDIATDSIRFVILIDDLDRCLPETTIKLLESIKNFLTVKRCIFVLGLNPAVVYQGIRVKYQGLEVNGREYLEKILNYSFYVPEPQVDQLAVFGAHQLSRLVDEQARQQLAPKFDEFGRVLRDCQFNNPRKIKRILNRYLFFLNTYNSTADDYLNANIVRLIIMAEYFADIFQLYLKNADKVSDAIAQIGKEGFQLVEFERDFGVAITPIYSQLVKMRRLFELVKSTNPNRPDLSGHVHAVFSITRLI